MHAGYEQPLQNDKDSASIIRKYDDFKGRRS